MSPSLQQRATDAKGRLPFSKNGKSWWCLKLILKRPTQKMLPFPTSPNVMKNEDITKILKYAKPVCSQLGSKCLHNYKGNWENLKRRNCSFTLYKRNTSTRQVSTDRARSRSKLYLYTQNYRKLSFRTTRYAFSSIVTKQVDTNVMIGVLL